MKRILYYSEQKEGSNHTSVEGIFNKYLQKYFRIVTIYYGKSTKIGKSKIIIEKSKKGNICNILKNRVELEQFDFIIIRNDYKVLNSFINNKNNLSKNVKIGLQISFLHSFRRFYESFTMNQSLVRKFFEYLFVSKYERKLKSKVDFLLPISKMMNSVTNENNIKSFNMYLGIDFSLLPQRNFNLVKNKIVKFIYIGTVDKLREMDSVFKAFDNVKSDNWELDIYTKNTKYTFKLLEDIRCKNKINVLEAIPREELYSKIMEYNVGISLIPVNDLYVVSSPIKLSEYFACGVPVITTAIPEAVDLFANNNCAFFVNFDQESIADELNNLLILDKNELNNKGQIGKNIVYKKRNYEIISENLSVFLNKL